MENAIRQVLRLRIPGPKKLAIIRRLLFQPKQTVPKQTVPKIQTRPLFSNAFGFRVQKKPLPKPVVKETPKKCALIMGSNYSNTSFPLQGCLNDVNFLYTKLVALNYNQISQISDGTQVKPLKGNVINALIDLLSKANSGDILFFGYSGHGTQITDANNDEKDGLDECLVCSDLTLITDDEFKEIINNYLKPGVKLFCVIDACHSGSCLDLKYQCLDSSNFNKLTIDAKQTETLGQIVMISGSMDSQTSADAYIKNKYRGAMLWAFLQVINVFPVINFKNLLIKMRNLLKASGFSQIPQLSAGQNLDLNSKIFI